MNKEHVVEAAAASNEAAISEFDEVLEYAVEVCLSNPSEFWERVDVRTKELEASKDQRPELWKKRAELELEYNGTIFSKEEYPSYHDVVDSPESYVPPANYAVQAKIEAFGQALLNEAFLCLGEDAPEKAAQYANADNEKERNKIQVWLYNRVQEISIKQEKLREERLRTQAEVLETEATVYARFCQGVDIEDIAQQEPSIDSPNKFVVEWLEGQMTHNDIYNPARLSPKLLGVYPDTRLDPTCLSKSILVSSFFEKTGVPYLHAGVMRTAPDIGRLIQMYSVESILIYAKRQQYKLPDNVLQLISSIMTSYDKSVDSQNSFHASVVARVADEYWSLVDPNYDTFVGIDPEESKSLDDIHHKLGSIAVTQPGVELAMLHGTAYSLSVFPSGVTRVLKETQDLVDIESLLLQFAQSDEPLEAIKNYILNQIASTELGFDGVTHSEIYDYFVDSLLKGKKNKPQAKMDYIDEALTQTVKTYVFADLESEGIDKCMNRLKTDKAYLIRRAEDMRMAPAYVTMKIISNVVNMLIKKPNNLRLPHLSLELGLPAYRIGACVLSDFDFYNGSNLPFSFWASNWTSYVSFGNHTPSIEDVVQFKMAAKLLKSTDSDLLSYLSSRGIIRKFLEQKEKENE